MQTIQYTCMAETLHSLLNSRQPSRPLPTRTVPSPYRMQWLEVNNISGSKELSTTHLMTVSVSCCNCLCYILMKYFVGLCDHHSKILNNLLFLYPTAGDRAIEAIQDAMDVYEVQTCISFQERSNQEDYVRFFSGNGYIYIFIPQNSMYIRMIAVTLLLYKALWLHYLL